MMKLNVVLSTKDERMTVEATKVGPFAVTREVYKAGSEWKQYDRFYQLYHVKTGMRMTETIQLKKSAIQLAKDLIQMSPEWDKIDGSSAQQTTEVLGLDVAKAARKLIRQYERGELA